MCGWRWGVVVRCVSWLRNGRLICVVECFHGVVNRRSLIGSLTIVRTGRLLLLEKVKMRSVLLRRISW